MSTPLPLNKPIANPSLKDLLDAHKKDIFLSLNCHAIATIQSFDAQHQTVKAKVNYKKTFFTMDSERGQYRQISEEYPLLMDLPVMQARGGSAYLTMPIKAGDTCLILFNDRDINNWFATGQSTATGTLRLHSFSDGIAFVGVSSMVNLIQNYDQIRALLTDGNCKVGFNTATDLLTLQNNTTSLKTVLSTLKTDLSTLATSLSAVATALGGNPGVETAAAAAGTALATAATTLTTSLVTLQTLINGLLE